MTKVTLHPPPGSASFVEFHPTKAHPQIRGLIRIVTKHARHIRSLTMSFTGVSTTWVIDGHSDQYHYEQRESFRADALVVQPSHNAISQEGSHKNEDLALIYPFSIELPGDVPPSLGKEAAYRCGVIGEGSGDFGHTYVLTATATVDNARAQNVGGKDGTSGSEERISRVKSLTRRLTGGGKSKTGTKVREAATEVELMKYDVSLVTDALTKPRGLVLRDDKHSVASYTVTLTRSVLVPGESFEVRFQITPHNAPRERVRAVRVELIQYCCVNLHGASTSTREGEASLVVWDGAEETPGQYSENECRISIDVPPVSRDLPPSHVWPDLIKFEYFVRVTIKFQRSEKMDLVFPVQITSLDQETWRRIVGAQQEQQQQQSQNALPPYSAATRVAEQLPAYA
ncbi:hypothetical protein HK102_007443 [Quaeritorhiza haematococci]|nr:hypothetical protein HK102_007443 [Quaeritorhiza haematococci]